MPPPAVRSASTGRYGNHVIMLFRSIDPLLAGRCQSEVRSRGGDGLHLHNTVARGVPSDREATSRRGGRAASSSSCLRLHAEPQSSGLFPWPAVRRSQTDSGSQSPVLLSDITSRSVCCCQTLRYHSDLFSKPHLAPRAPPQRRANGPR